MFTLLRNLHSDVSRLLLNLDIGVRLLVLMGLAAALALLLASSGILGLAASTDSLRAVYEERMRPLQQLAEISNLMLENRLLLERALGELAISADPLRPGQMDRETASANADAIEKNIESINQLWHALCVILPAAGRTDTATTFWLPVDCLSSSYAATKRGELPIMSTGSDSFGTRTNQLGVAHAEFVAQRVSSPFARPMPGMPKNSLRLMQPDLTGPGARIDARRKGVTGVLAMGFRTLRSLAIVFSRYLGINEHATPCPHKSRLSLYGLWVFELSLGKALSPRRLPRLS